MRDFAPDFDRTPGGWVIFPRDVELRRMYFPPVAMKHPAKANIHMIQAIVEMVSEPGETILDPMSGTGTLMIAAVQGRRVICIEVEEWYHEIQRDVLRTFELLNPGMGHVTLINADCTKVLPLPTDHIIFSPPYAMILKMASPTSEAGRHLTKPYTDDIHRYSQSQGNVGILNKFFYNQVMEKVYRLCYESLRPGGTITVILQDYYATEGSRERRRIYLSKWMENVCLKAGFTQVAWNKRSAPNTAFKQLWLSRGMDMVLDEDIVTYRKEAHDDPA